MTEQGDETPARKRRGNDDFDPRAEFDAWRGRDRRGALRVLAGDAAGVDAARRRLAMLGILVASNPFEGPPAGRLVVGELPGPGAAGGDPDAVAAAAEPRPKFDWKRYMPKPKRRGDE